MSQFLGDLDPALASAIDLGGLLALQALGACGACSADNLARLQDLARGAGRKEGDYGVFI